MSDVYYSPELFGLTIVDDVDLAGAYEFDKHVIWTDGTNYFYASDSGCSCPSPFEDYHSLADLTLLERPEQFDEIEQDVRRTRSEGDDPEGFIQTLRDLRRRVRDGYPE